MKGGRSQRQLARLKAWPTANDLGTKRQEEHRTYERIPPARLIFRQTIVRHPAAGRGDIFGPRTQSVAKTPSIFEMCTTTIPESINGPMVFAAELQIAGNLVTDIALPQ